MTNCKGNGGGGLEEGGHCLRISPQLAVSSLPEEAQEAKGKGAITLLQSSFLPVGDSRG